MKIEQEINQKKFSDQYQKAHINILFTASWLSQKSAHILRPLNMSWQQFNILRILRGMSPEPATVKILTERMIDKMSNASRLVDKLKSKGLVERVSCPEDRRRVNVYITEEGLKTLDKASELMDDGLRDHMRNLDTNEAAELNRLLDTLRD